MSEKFPQSPAAAPKEGFRTQQGMRDDPRYAAYLEEHKDLPMVSQESPEACATKIAECEEMIASFEETHDLEALHAITSFASKAERISSIRQPALEALTPIFKLLKLLNKQDAVVREDYDRLKAEHARLSRAVGTVTDDPSGAVFALVVHDR